MKFIIDKMPNPDECIFSKWEVYPPFMELTGEWYCMIDKKNMPYRTKSMQMVKRTGAR